jgi:hypothetical protein
MKIQSCLKDRRYMNHSERLKCWTSEETTLEALQRKLNDHWIAVVLTIASIGAVVLIILNLTAYSHKEPSILSDSSTQPSLTPAIQPTNSISTPPTQESKAEHTEQPVAVPAGIRDITAEVTPAAVKPTEETLRQQEKLINQFVSNFEGLLRILKGVSDEESARAALPMLQVARNLMILQIKELHKIATMQQRAILLRDKLPQMQSAGEKIEAEITRLKTLPNVYQLLEPQLPNEKNMPKIN